jgi:hypothetical protein
MPTARELLEQAEALMLRNRSAMMAESRPAIDESVASARTVKAALSPALDMPATPATLDDIPLLTDAVEDFDTPSIPHPQRIEDESSFWNEAVDEDLTNAARGPDSLAQLPQFVPPAPTESGRETSLAEIKGFTRIPDVGELIGTPAMAPAQVASPFAPDAIPPATPPTSAPTDNAISVATARRVGPEAFAAEAEDAAVEAARWNSLAEEVRMQVLQRIDIFTDTGLKEQLNQRLQPIVDRLSADLVAAINQHVGQLLREYVAEAIEREIETWRKEVH